jgi:CO dehydrogenase/acetyl-CoA synthase alpha subunit
MGDTSNDAQRELQGVLGMLRGVDEMIQGNETWNASELRKIESKLKAVSAAVAQRVESLREEPKKAMTYDALVGSIEEMIRCAPVSMSCPDMRQMKGTTVCVEEAHATRSCPRARVYRRRAGAGR